MNIRAIYSQKHVSFNLRVIASAAKQSLCFIVLIAFLANMLGPVPLAQAQASPAISGDFRLPAPGVMVHLSPEFNPPILKGIKVYPDNPFRFDFILDKGDSLLGQDQLKDESSKLIKYFLASLTIPEKDLWVNLSPYEKDRIIPNSFGLTEMGRDLLAEDYMLKQITASLIYPEGEVGKKFWKRIYEEAVKKFGTTNIPVNTFNKVWIVPEKAMVYENAKAGTAYVVESKLKVMLEQDYLALSHNVIPAPTGAWGQAKAGPHAGHSQELGIQNKSDINALGSQIVREIVIPELTKEVNEDKNFVRLRQVYNSLILATWYKKKIKDSILSQVYADKRKVAGMGYGSSVIVNKVSLRRAEGDAAISDTERIYQRYLQAFKKGVYNYIKEEQDPLTQQVIPRKYFSGGMVMRVHIQPADGAMLASFLSKLKRLKDRFLGLSVNIKPVLGEPQNGQMVSGQERSLDLASSNIKNLFDTWAKSRKAKNELIYEARKLGFEGVNIENYSEHALNGNTYPEISSFYRLIKDSKIYNLYQGVLENVMQHAGGNAVYLWREGSEGYEFFMFDYGPGVLNKEGRPVEDLRKIFNKGYSISQGNGYHIGGGFGVGTWITAENSFLLRLISINDGKIHIVTKKPEKNEHIVVKQNTFPSKGLVDISGVIVHGFVPFNETNFHGEFTDPTDKDILGAIRMQLPSLSSQRDLWQSVPTKELDSLKPGDKVTFKYNRQRETYLSIRKDVQEAVHSGTLKEVASPENQGVFIFENGPTISYAKITKVQVDTAQLRAGDRAMKSDESIKTRKKAAMEYLIGLGADFNKLFPEAAPKIAPMISNQNHITETITDTNLYNLVPKVKELARSLKTSIGIHVMPSADLPGILNSMFLGNSYIISPQDLKGDTSDAKARKFLREFMGNLTFNTFGFGFKTRKGVPSVPITLFIDTGTEKGKNFTNVHVSLVFERKISFEDRLLGLIQWQFNEIDKKEGDPLKYEITRRYIEKLLEIAKKQNSNVKKKIAGQDEAMNIAKNNKTGGIDLTPANMNLQTRNNGGEIKFYLDPAQLAQLQNAPGFVPVIINIQPMTNLRMFLGLADSSLSTN